MFPDSQKEEAKSPPSNQQVTWQSPGLMLSGSRSLAVSLPLTLLSHPFLEVIFILEMEAPATASSITKKNKDEKYH